MKLNEIVPQLDLRQSRHWSMNTSPDVLILPSRLTQLVAPVHNTLVINPGSIGRGRSYVDMNIHPLPQDEVRNAHIQDNSTELPHNVIKRTAVTILKI